MNKASLLKRISDFILFGSAFGQPRIVKLRGSSSDGLHTMSKHRFEFHLPARHSDIIFDPSDFLKNEFLSSGLYFNRPFKKFQQICYFLIGKFKIAKCVDCRYLVSENRQCCDREEELKKGMRYSFTIY